MTARVTRPQHDRRLIDHHDDPTIEKEGTDAPAQSNRWSVCAQPQARAATAGPATCHSGRDTWAVVHSPAQGARGQGRATRPQDQGQAGFQLGGGGGGDRAPWLDPPPHKKKGSIDGTCEILPRLTPGPRRRPRPKNRQKMKMGFFGISASRGFRKNVICHVIWGGKTLTTVNAQKKISAPSAPEFVITDQWSCQLSLFPRPPPPPPQFWGALLTPPPPVESPTAPGLQVLRLVRLARGLHAHYSSRRVWDPNACAPTRAQRSLSVSKLCVVPLSKFWWWGGGGGGGRPMPKGESTSGPRGRTR